MQFTPDVSAGVAPRKSLSRCVKYSLGALVVLTVVIGWRTFSYFYPWTLKATLRGHQGWVPCVAFAPNGKTLATGGQDHTVRLWDVATGKETAVLRGHTDTVQAVAFSPNRRLLATASADGSVRIWEVGTGRPRAVLLGHLGPDVDGKPMPTYTVAFSPDSRTLASGGADETVRLWEVATGKQRAVFQSTKDVFSLVITPNGKLLASMTRGGIITVWDLASRRKLRQFGEDEGGISRLLLEADGKTLANNATTRDKVRLWDVTTGRQLATLKAKLNWQDSPVNAMAFSPDGKVLAATTMFGARILFWDTASGKLLGSIHFPRPSSIAFSPDGSILASSHEDGTVKLWDAAKLIPRK